MRLDHTASGVYAIAATPFLPEGSVDYGPIDRLQKRGAIAHDTQRKPAAQLSAAAKQEIDYLLSRVARHDARAAL